MKALLNHLKEKICIINEEQKILFANQAFLMYLEEGHQALRGKNIAEYIKFQKHPLWLQNTQSIEILSGYHIRKVGEAFCYMGTWEQGVAYYVILEMPDEQEQKTKILEQMMDQMVPQICIHDVRGKYIYANENYGKHINKNFKDLPGQKAQDVLEPAYYEICSKEDAYVIKHDSLCVTTEWIEKGDKKRNYRILRIPLKSKGEKIDHIGYVIYDNTCTTQIEEKVFEVIKQFEAVEYIEQELPRDGDLKTFKELKGILEQYMETDYLSIWSYDQIKESLKPYVGNLDLGQDQKEAYCFKIKQKYVEQNLKSQDSPVYLLEELIEDEIILKKLELQGYSYIVIHPIFYREVFTGMITMMYKQLPSYKVVKNDSIAGICHRLGIIIHEQKVAQKLRNELIRRREAERELQGFLDISANIMGKLDENNGFIRINKGVESVLGWTPEEFLQQNWKTYTYPEDIEYLKENILGKGRHGNIQSRYRHKNGEYKWFQWYWKEMENYCGVYFTAKDITEYKEWEQQQKQIEEVLQLEEVRKEFFANVSHELRTPLAILMGVHQLIKEDLSPHHNQIIKQNTNRLLRLINNLIDITKIDAGYYQIQKGNYNIISLVEELVLSVVEYAGDKSIEVIFDTEVEEEIIACDKDQIERIILNLLSNAIKYNVVGGRIEVAITLTPSTIQMSVMDTGVGIPEDQMPFIFERFMQVDNILTRKSEGSGIGLSLVKALVEMHEGHITVDSKEGQTVFQVSLPRKQLPAAEISHAFLSEGEALEKCRIELSDIQIRNI